MNQLAQSVRAVALLVLLMAVLAVVEVIFTSSVQRRRRLSLANVGLTILSLALNLALSLVTAQVVEVAWDGRPGVLGRFGVPGLMVPVVAVIVLDFATYVAHVAMHRVPWLWRVHRVHHVDPVVDVTTSLRHHPIETVVRCAVLLLPALALGLPAAAITTYRMISAVSGLLEHANVRLWRPLDRLLSLVFTTPNVHKVHHSRRRVETDSNYGNILSIFDRLFQTFTSPARVHPAERGLHGYERVDSAAFHVALGLPFRGDVGERGR